MIGGDSNHRTDIPDMVGMANPFEMAIMFASSTVLREETCTLIVSVPTVLVNTVISMKSAVSKSTNKAMPMTTGGLSVEETWIDLIVSS